MERSGHKGCKIATAKKVFLMIFVHLFTLFKRLFAPTSRGKMSKPFRFSESLGIGDWRLGIGI